MVGISDFFELIHGIQDINVWDTSNCVFHELSFMRSSKNITKLCTLVSTSKTMAGFGHAFSKNCFMKLLTFHVSWGLAVSFLNF